MNDTRRNFLFRAADSEKNFSIPSVEIFTFHSCGNREKKVEINAKNKKTKTIISCH
jgi:hypothetical protein